MRQVVVSELPPRDQGEAEKFERFVMRMEEVEMLCKCNKIRKHSSRGVEEGEMRGEEEEEKEVDEEKMCNICYFTEKDTVIVPCGHMTCNKCIQVHT